jgi:thiol-disulfide isomerase/thioredoxin
MTQRRLTLLILLVGAVSAGAVAMVWATKRYESRGGVEASVPAGGKVTLRFFRDPSAVASLAARDLDGRPIASADWRGKVTIVNFWATWCPPCRAEIPALIALQEKYRDRLQIIGVSQDEGSTEAVKRFAAEHKVNYPIVMMTPELEHAFPGVDALPTSFVVDRTLRIVQKHVGMLDPVITELETRALAGLGVNASIEQVDRVQKAHLENNAQATVIPGVDLAVLSPDQRAAALQKLNTDACTCGCDLTLAKCRIDDPSCGVSLPLAREIVKQIRR